MKRKYPKPKYLFGLLAAWRPALTEFQVCEVRVTWDYISAPKIFLQLLYAVFMVLLWSIPVRSPQDKSAKEKLVIRAVMYWCHLVWQPGANPGPFWLTMWTNPQDLLSQLSVRCPRNSLEENLRLELFADESLMFVSKVVVSFWQIRKRTENISCALISMV